VSTLKGCPKELKLVDVAELEALIGATATLDAAQKEYLRRRWLHQICWWDNRAWEARNRYFWLRRVIVIGGVVVPYLAAASFEERVDFWLRSAAAVLSLIVAAAAGLEALHGWGGIWLEKRRAAELLKAEGWLFLHGGGAYKGGVAGETFSDFVTEVESQIAAEVGEYIAVAQKSRESARGSAPAKGETPAKPNKQS
jgi:hypothetical protein